MGIKSNDWYGSGSVIRTNRRWLKCVINWSGWNGRYPKKIGGFLKNQKTLRPYPFETVVHS